MVAPHSLAASIFSNTTIAISLEPDNVVSDVCKSNPVSVKFSKYQLSSGVTSLNIKLFNDKVNINSLKVIGSPVISNFNVHV